MTHVEHEKNLWLSYWVVLVFAPFLERIFKAVLGPIVRWIVSYLTVVPLFALLGRLWPLVHIACYVALWFPFQWPEKTRKSTWQPGGHASPPPPIAHRHRVNVASLTLSTLFFPHFNKLWGMPQLRPLLQWLGILGGLPVPRVVKTTAQRFDLRTKTLGHVPDVASSSPYRANDHVASPEMDHVRRRLDDVGLSRSVGGSPRHTPGDPSRGPVDGGESPQLRRWSPHDAAHRHDSPADGPMLRSRDSRY